MIFIAAFPYFIAFSDFITVLLTSENIDNTYGWYGAVIMYLIVPPFTLISSYIGCELLIPKKKKQFMFISFVLTIALELILALDPIASVDIKYPNILGEDIVHYSIIPSSLLFFIGSLYSTFISFFNGFGLLKKGFQSEGVIKKKFTFLSLAFISYWFFGLTDVVRLFPLVITFFLRMGIIFSLIFFYLGLREESEVKQPKKEIKIEEALFRITKRPDSITEEEVTFHKEKKICLVCKGKALKFTYICPKCEALYCVNCAQALTNLENTCWVCETVIDDTKPSKSYKKDKIEAYKGEKTSKVKDNLNT